MKTYDFLVQAQAKLLLSALKNEGVGRFRDVLRIYNPVIQDSPGGEPPTLHIDGDQTEIRQVHHNGVHNPDKILWVGPTSAVEYFFPSDEEVNAEVAALDQSCRDAYEHEENGGVII